MVRGAEIDDSVDLVTMSKQTSYLLSLIHGFLEPRELVLPQMPPDWFSHFRTAHLWSSQHTTETNSHATFVEIGCICCTVCRRRDLKKTMQTYATINWTFGFYEKA